mgnify:CR=1 FL=1
MKRILIADDLESWQKYNHATIKEIFPEAEFVVVDSAKSAYTKILENNNTPFDIIVTDMQMEEDFSPLYAGEWLISQIQTLQNYYRTQIVIISGTNNIKQIAESYNVDYIRKSVACNDKTSYGILLAKD